MKYTGTSASYFSPSVPQLTSYGNLFQTVTTATSLRISVNRTGVVTEMTTELLIAEIKAKLQLKLLLQSMGAILLMNYLPGHLSSKP